MLNRLKSMIRWLPRKLGYDIHRTDLPWQNPYDDMQRMVSRVDRPTIFDVGANVGQTVDRFRSLIPNCTIHSFEPSPTTFAQLRDHCANLRDVHVWNCGVGSSAGSLTLLENSHSDMSSFLTPGPAGWGEIVRKTEVPVITLDAFAEREKIDHVHILKSDTQGFDFEVLKGADRLLREGRVDLVFYEVTVSKMYEHIPPYYDVFRFLGERGFLIASMYNFHYGDGRLSWMDVLFAAERIFG